MKLAVRLLAVIAILALAAGTANAQIGNPGGTTKSSILLTPPSDGGSAATMVSAPTTFSYGSLGWDLFLNSHANRLILAMSRWQPTPNRVALPVTVRMPISGNRVTR
jgi:hypothetical protein